MSIETSLGKLVIKHIIAEKGYLDAESISYYAGIELAHAQTIVNAYTLREINKATDKEVI